MRYLIVLEGAGGELDRELTATDDDAVLTRAVIKIATRCQLVPGDTIKIIDTEPEQ